MFILTEQEKNICPRDPDVLRALADWHDAQSTLSEAMGYDQTSARHHDRMLVLLEEAMRIEASWEQMSESPSPS